MPSESAACGFSPQERRRRPKRVLYRIIERMTNSSIQMYVAMYVLSIKVEPKKPISSVLP